MRLEWADPVHRVVVGGFRAREAEEGLFQSLLLSSCGRTIISAFFSVRGKRGRDSI